MEKTKIEWTDYTWNPVIGCLHECFYCYARKWAKRAGEDFKPSWREKQYRKPYKIKEPSKIFVCSLADLFGDWVPKEWIEKVLQVVKDNPQHTFQFLTKNPGRYLEFHFPQNCWLGITIDVVNQARLNYLKENKEYNHKFISFEPLLSDMSSLCLDGIDWAIIGADSTIGAESPKKEWVLSLIRDCRARNIPIFLKSNLKWPEKIQEFPKSL